MPQTIDDTVIIGISGKKRAGKDTLARYYARNYGVKRDWFAKPIKEAAISIFGFSHEQVYGDLKEVEDPYWGFSPRWAMQKIGTELFRDLVGSDVWIKSLFARNQVVDMPLLIIPDVRFPNEAMAIKQRGGIVIRINRKRGPQKDQHRSETALDTFQDFDYVIDNNRTLDGLFIQGEMALQKYLDNYTEKGLDYYTLENNISQKGKRRYTTDYDPQLDSLTIASDLDGVHAGFAPAFCRRAAQLGVNSFHDHFTEWITWSANGKGDAFSKVWKDVENDPDFWKDEIQPLESSFITFPVSYYVTARPQPSLVTKQWLRMHGYPEAEVITVPPGASKAKVLTERGVDVFIDDKPSTVIELNEAGIRTYLVGTPANQQYRRTLPYIPYPSFLPWKLMQDGIIESSSSVEPGSEIEEAIRKIFQTPANGKHGTMIIVDEPEEPQMDGVVGYINGEFQNRDDEIIREGSD